MTGFPLAALALSACGSGAIAAEGKPTAVPLYGRTLSFTRPAEIAKRAFYPTSCNTRPYTTAGGHGFGGGLKRSLIVNGCASLPPDARPKAPAHRGSSSSSATPRRSTR